MKIAIDFDDCIVDSCPLVIEHLNKIAGTSLKREDIFSMYFVDVWKIDEKVIKEGILNLYSIENENDFLPIKGAIEAINKLNEKHELIIITGRPEHTSCFVNKWLEKHLPNVFKKIIYTNQHFGVKKEKALVCEEEGVEIFIDDYDKNVFSVSEKNIRCFLIDNPWNQGEIPENVKRVKGWEEIVEEVHKNDKVTERMIG